VCVTGCDVFWGSAIDSTMGFKGLTKPIGEMDKTLLYQRKTNYKLYRTEKRQEYLNYQFQSEMELSFLLYSLLGKTN